MSAHLFVMDPLERINPAKDSTSALMQAAQRAGLCVWAATPADLSASEADQGHGCWVRACPVTADPWYSIGEPQRLPLTQFAAVWMRKDPPVDEAYLYATHLLDLAERQGVRVLNRPAALRAWNEKLSALRWSHLMAPTLVASRVDDLAARGWCLRRRARPGCGRCWSW